MNSTTLSFQGCHASTLRKVSLWSTWQHFGEVWRKHALLHEASVHLASKETSVTQMMKSSLNGIEHDLSQLLPIQITHLTISNKFHEKKQRIAGLKWLKYFQNLRAVLILYKWLIDYLAGCLPFRKVAAEVEGGMWMTQVLLIWMVGYRFKGGSERMVPGMHFTEFHKKIKTLFKSCWGGNRMIIHDNSTTPRAKTDMSLPTNRSYNPLTYLEIFKHKYVW